MKVYNDQKLTIYFGDASDEIFPPYNPWPRLTSVIPNLSGLFFAHQVHGIDGHVVTAEFISKNAPWSLDGDYLLTDEQGLGIGVLTADCLPLVLYDPCNHAAAVIHAGWRGAVAGIATKAALHMNEVYGTKMSDLKVFMGPCAGSCCYRVGSELLAALPTTEKKCTEERDDGVYFNLARFNGELLINNGICAHSCNYQYHSCTICNPAYFSYRRQQEKAGRQMTVVCLV